MKSGKGSSLTLEFQTAKTDSQFFVRISVQPRRSFPNKLDKKISIFFTNGQRIVLSTPVREEQIDQMQELFFSLTESQVTLLENNQISKIQYGIIENIDYNKKINKVFLADAVPYTE